MRPRFQADADFNQLIVKATLRREPSIDFQSAQTANLSGLGDREVLALAARDSRVLVTHDRKTMPAHFAEFVRSVESAGVLIVPQKLLIAKVVDDLILIWAASEAEEWVNRIRSLPL
ncbi:MAG TPA: DUF5615 family PIN-like protein [Thermoanaerobaculia bacterium]|nr:DUF5615 family PIN-like protein [Thermoanaerobaculia bacterium]